MTGTRLLEKDETGLLVKRMEEVRGRPVPEVHHACPARTSASTSSASIRSCSKLVEKFSDEKLEKMRRGGHDPEKVYAAYKSAIEQRGSADGHPGQDDQGIRPRRRRRRAEHRAPGRRKPTKRSCASSAAGSASRSPTNEIAKTPFYRPAEDSPEIRYLKARRKALGRLRAQPAHGRTQDRSADDRRVPGVPGRQQGQGDVHDDGLRAAAGQAVPRSAGSASTWCRSSPTNRGRSAWRACSARSGSIRTPASCTNPSTPIS